MSSDTRTKRLAHFKDYHLLWVAVHHFLSADLIEELSDAVIATASEGTLTLGELFETLRTEGTPALVSWAIRPRETSRTLGKYLQRLVRGLVWQHDDAPRIYGENVEKAEVSVMEALEAAYLLGYVDLQHEAVLAQYHRKAPPQLEALLNGMIELRACARSSADASIGIANSATSSLEMPLKAVVVKHLADLSADMGQWDVAKLLYLHTESLLSEYVDASWVDFVHALKAMTVLSCASATRELSGVKEAADKLVKATDSSTIECDLMLLANGTSDALNAISESLDRVDVWRDTRVAVSRSPQLLGSLNLSVAFEHWADKKYDDAQRVFWAVLRRQLALGTATSTRVTKSYFGRCVIDSLEAGLAKQRYSDRFFLGVRLLVESGDANVADQTNWTEQLVQVYVDVASVAATVGLADVARGSTLERRLVTIALLKRWLVVLAPDASSIAADMLSFLAECARDGEGSLFTHRDLGGAGLRALAEVAKVRPEFRQLIGDRVADAVIERLKGHFSSITVALESVLGYLDALGRDALYRLIDAILDMLENPQTSVPWPLVRSATDVLISPAVKEMSDRDRQIGKRVTSTIVRLSIEQETENARLLFILSDLTPDLAKEEIGAEKLGTIVGEVRKRALVTNSSNAIYNVMALFIAPWASHLEGIRDAFKSLLGILESAAAGRPSISFAGSYSALLLLAEKKDVIARDLPQPPAEFADQLDKVFIALIHVWESVKDVPLLFNSFALPAPTAPNLTLVHNWTFASIGFARALEREHEMVLAMAAAAQMPELADTIALARAIRGPANMTEPFDARSIGAEKRDAFYGALGQRLVLMRTLPSASREDLTKILLDRCLRLGPQGLDAGIFAAAFEVGVQIKTEKSDFASYRSRLDNDRHLRISLMPMLNGLAEGARQ